MNRGFGDRNSLELENINLAQSNRYTRVGMSINMGWDIDPHIYIYICVCVIIHCCDIIMGVMASQITSLTIAYSTVYSGADQGKHQSPASLAFVLGIHQ